MRTRASDSIGRVRSVSWSLTITASAALASRGEIAWARSAPVVPADTRRTDPSGRVREISPDSTAELIDGEATRHEAGRRARAEGRARRGCSNRPADLGEW